MKAIFNVALRKWSAPLALAILSILGLVCALVGDGVWDYIGVVSLSVPMIVSVWIIGKLRDFD